MSLRFNSCGNVDCLCLNHTKAPEYSMSDQRRANAVPLSKLAQSNSKSEDTPRMIDAHRKQLKAQRWLQDNTHEGMTPEPPQDTCGCLCHNPDALKWGCEHCAMPPQYTTIHDVVNGTPKGQEAVQKAIDDSIKVQNEIFKEAQDTSLDEQLMEVMLYVRTTHEVEHNDNQWTREFVFSFDEAKAKINRLMLEARLAGAIDCATWVMQHDESSFRQERAWFKVKPALFLKYQAELLKELQELSNNLKEGR